MNRMTRKSHKEKRATVETVNEDKQKKYTGMERSPIDDRVKERFFKPAYKKWGER